MIFTSLSHPTIAFGLFSAGLLTGFIDAVIGGGGLISVPVMMLTVGIGVGAIATNKIVGLTAAFCALLVYRKHGHFKLKTSLPFSLAIMLGSLIGSIVSPHLPTQAFKYFLYLTCPLLILSLYQKNIWFDSAAREARRHHNPQTILLATLLSGLACGLYDGMWGPGAGVFMALALILFAKQSIFTALASAKFANALSALVALSQFSLNPQVRPLIHWEVGLACALGVAMGATYGAHCAVKNSARIIRPVMLVVVLLLVLKIWQTG